MWIDSKILSYFPDNLLSTAEVEVKFLVQNPVYLFFYLQSQKLLASVLITFLHHSYLHALLPSLGLRETVPQRSPDFV